MRDSSGGFRFFLTRAAQATDHVWLVMMKAMRALTRYAASGIEEMTPGSIGIAGDRLVAKGLVSRVESVGYRRVRIVALTPRGKNLIVSAFRQHSGQMKRVFAELSPEELRGLEVMLKKVGKRAAALMDES
jgi:DNA-binding MarR family transcriptional regulator